MWVVFDALAECYNISLNDKSLLRIDYLNSLLEVLAKLWHGKYAAMWKVKVKGEDLDAVSFIWRDSKQDEISDYIMLSHVFGKKDSMHRQLEP